MADRLDSLGSQRVTLKCDTEVDIIAQVEKKCSDTEEEGNITIPGHLEEEETQGNHLAEGSVYFVLVLIRTLTRRAEASPRTVIGPGRLVP